MSLEISRDEHKDFAEIKLDRTTTADNICRNLVAAGVLLPEEVERYKKDVLQKYNPITLVSVLLESHQLRETHEESKGG